MALSSDGARLASIDVYGGLAWRSVTNAGFGDPTSIQTVPGSNPRLALSPNDRLFAVSSYDKTVTILDAKDGRILRTLTPRERMRGIAFSPSGSMLACGSHSHEIYLWDLSSGDEKIITIPKAGDQSDVWSVAFSRDGKFLGTGHMDSSITVWNAATRGPVHNFFVRGAACFQIAFHPDGTLLATAQADGNVYLWETQTAKRVAQLQGHSKAVRCLAFSRDGSMLVSGSDDGTLILWK
jgi:WD40 repeat protein